MKYLLIAFVVFLALAPLSHFVPTKRQRLVARLREYAAVNGLFVEFRPPPGSADDAAHVTGSSGLIYYGKRIPPGRGTPIGRGAWVRDEDGWRARQRPAPVPEPLSKLPPEIGLATLDEGSCGVFWAEEGGEETVELICQVLGEWTAALRPGAGNFS
jgi:hypothetical protein